MGWVAKIPNTEKKNNSISEKCWIGLLTKDHLSPDFYSSNQLIFMTRYNLFFLAQLPSVAPHYPAESKISLSLIYKNFP